MYILYIYIYYYIYICTYIFIDYFVLMFFNCYLPAHGQLWAILKETV